MPVKRTPYEPARRHYLQAPLFMSAAPPSPGGARCAIDPSFPKALVDAALSIPGPSTPPELADHSQSPQSAAGRRAPTVHRTARADAVAGIVKEHAEHGAEEDAGLWPPDAANT